MSRGIPKVKQWRARFVDANGRTIGLVYVFAPTRWLARMNLHHRMVEEGMYSAHVWRETDTIKWSVCRDQK